MKRYRIKVKAPFNETPSPNLEFSTKKAADYCYEALRGLSEEHKWGYDYSIEEVK